MAAMHFKLCLSCLAILLSVVMPSVSFAADINGIRLYRAPDNTRLVFDLDGAVEHKILLVDKDGDKPARLVIDIMNTALNPKINTVFDVKETPITQLRFGQQGDFDLRVVLDLKSDVIPKSFILKPNEQYGHRLVVDLDDKVVALPPIEVTKMEPVPSNGQLRDILIMIDAGHGGEDPGAIGPGRVREKDITLRIAKTLADVINQRKGYRAELTRKGDYYIDLRKRSKMARDRNADLFVSIHADAFKNPKASGASVFAWSQRGATSETAKFLADSENLSDLVGGADPNSVDDTLVQVLADLQLDGTVRLSLGMGGYVLKEVGKVAKLHKQHVEQAGFMVLKSVNVPSLLVETGFISNPTEARNLNSSGYQLTLSKAIFTGIDKHFTKIPPPDTYIGSLKEGSLKGFPSSVVASASISMMAEANAEEVSVAETKIPEMKPVVRKPSARKPSVHTVKKGDNLSDIATRYGVSLSAVKKLNKLKSSKIFVGQKLKIPT